MKDLIQRLEGPMYLREEELGYWDCDVHERLRPAAIFSKIASFGGYHYNALGFPRERLLEAGFVFLLSRITVNVHRLPRAGDILSIATWENGAKIVQVQRVFQMRDQTGALCISAKSDWVLADPVNHKILRPEAFTLRPLGHCPVEIDCPEPEKIVLPKTGGDDLGAYTVRYSDLDGNGHLFSGNYGDILWDALPPHLQDKAPKTLAINYSRECRLGDTLRIRGMESEKGYLVEGRREGAVSFAARVEFAP